MSRKSLFTTLALAAALMLAVVEPSLAASDIGENIGKELESWAQWLFFGVAGLVSLPVLFQRDLSQGVVIVGLVLVVGGFVFAGEQVQDAVEAVWQTVGNGDADVPAKGEK